ncbi:MAG: hypothetical protein U9Q69_04195 [Nanoarchaeota archaeon]|nr:hypothetical protein [Nanoarchaeota archaeon]
MKKFKTKSVLIGRKKSISEKPDVRPCFVNLFKNNDPHKSGEAPFEVLEFDEVHKVIVQGLNLSYLLPGNDILVNDLDFLKIDVKGPHVLISGKQKING